MWLATVKIKKKLTLENALKNKIIVKFNVQTFDKKQNVICKYETFFND